MKRTVASLLSASPVALSLGLASHLLAMDLPVAWGDDDDSPDPRKAVIERYTISRGVAVLPINGLLTFNNVFLEYYLGWSTYTGLISAATELATNTDVAAVAVEVNSPGGFVIGLEGAAQALAALAKVKPLHVLVNPLAASAAYWLASQGTDVTMTPGSVVGSIGVALTTSAPVQPDNWGEQWFAMTSGHARAKWPMPNTDEGKAELQRSLDESEARFHAAVAAGRKIDPAALTAQLSVTDDPRDGGAVFEGADAISRGLADVSQTRAEFYERIFGAYAPKPRVTGSRAFAARAAAALAAAAT